jgi:hypothetical protein
MEPKLKPPGIKFLKLKCDILLSTSAFKFNLRRYNWGKAGDRRNFRGWLAGPYTRPLLSST